MRINKSLSVVQIAKGSCCRTLSSGVNYICPWWAWQESNQCMSLLCWQLLFLWHLSTCC